MTNIQKLINEILADPKIAKSNRSASGVYRDEPILKTAAQITLAVPPEYREMRRIAKSYDTYSDSNARIFYLQAKFMENFEDDFDFQGTFFRYSPNYLEMNDAQLRGYFTWRTKVRKGVVNETSLSFVYVYIYELLNQIGVSTPEEGFATLKNFWETYRAIDNQITHYVKQWLKDYVVYYNLEKSLLEGIERVDSDSAVSTLLHTQEHTRDEVFSALNTLSSYHLENSKLFKKFPEDTKTIVCNVFDALSDHYNKKGKNSVCEKYFGRIYKNYYIMFRSALFYERVRHKKCVYEISDIYKYVYQDGYWYCERLYYYTGKNQELGALLKTIDFLMRPKYGINSTLKSGKSTKLMVEIIRNEIDKHQETKRKKEVRIIEIDVAKLHHIRKTSLETQKRLIVEEDEKEQVQVLAADTPEQAKTNKPVLNDTENRFMRCLLTTMDYDTLVQSEGLMVSVLVDAINEKFYDRFGDTVIVFDGDKPALLADYTDELKGIIEA